jgi:type II secretory pathway component PulJ
MILTSRARARRGFTLVELMVAASMCVLGMWLFTWLYKQGLDSFRTAKAQVDLMSQERSVIELLRRDLTADHFLDEDRKPNHGRKLSDQLRTLGTGYVLPRGGYFETTTAVPPVETPTGDADGFNSWRSNHSIRFTVVRPGGTPDNQYSVQTRAGGGDQYGGVGAEVAYFLIANGRTPNGVQLYDLHRRQRLVALNPDYAAAYEGLLNRPRSTALDPRDVAEVFALRNPTATAPPVQVLTFADLRANPALRVPFAPVTTNGRVGDDKILSNVVSFELKYTGTRGPTFTGRAFPDPFATNSDFPYDWLPTTGNTLDTGNNPQLRLTGVQVRLRVWNPKTLHARQTSVVIDL